MSHGNVATQVGTCEVCGREAVELHPSRNEDRRKGRRLLICVEELDCFEAWQEARA